MLYVCDSTMPGVSRWGMPLSGQDSKQVALHGDEKLRVVGIRWDSLVYARVSGVKQINIRESLRI